MSDTTTILMFAAFILAILVLLKPGMYGKSHTKTKNTKARANNKATKPTKAIAQITSASPSMMPSMVPSVVPEPVGYEGYDEDDE